MNTATIHAANTPQRHPARFDRVARPYQLLEALAFQRALQHARTAFLPTAAPSATRVLIVGEGDGRFLQAFRRFNPTAHVTVLDASPAMLALARARTAHLGPTTYFEADIRAHSLPPAEYDLIVTHFLLDCFIEPTAREIVARLTRSAAPNTRWLIADFHQPPTGLARWHARAWLAAMYTFFRLTTRLEARQLVDIPPLLAAAGFDLEARRSSRLGLIRSEVYRHAQSNPGSETR